MAKRRIPIEEIEAYEDGDYDYNEEAQQQTQQTQQTQRKRSRITSELDEDDVLIGNHISNEIHSEGDKLDDVNKVVKLILARDVKGQIFRKDLINQNLTNKRFKSDDLLKEAIKILENIYGLTLVETPIIKQENGSNSGLQSNKIKSKKTNIKSYVLVNTLSKEAKEVLGELWQKDIETVLDKSKIGETKFFLPSKKSTSLPKTNFDLIKTGIMMLIVTFIILEENHLSENQLIKNCKKFGISNSINTKNSNLNMNLDEILKEFSNQNYINKVNLSKDRIAGTSNDSNDQLIEYTLGRRSLVEFTPIDVFEYIKTIYGDDFNDAIKERCIVTLEKTYGVIWANLQPEAEAGVEEENIVTEAVGEALAN
ncbi:hypothetical protein KGF54_001859 [Candida jiufengensis]|uniref:uncharacterized protein n=1 Tax=Candida jiufengensis TaxID=497108 RepID=UPI0022255CBA|nr:uncharacterized protein KGF54_001859 [Candida jiufengensis]KAI5955298.1 hypothetical protein KGF54_001859 [Candida jiufengensis]